MVLVFESVLLYLVVLESGGLSVLDEAAELVLVGSAAAGLEAGGERDEKRRFARTLFNNVVQT